jgi:predicted PurR-regulated permease PerM
MEPQPGNSPEGPMTARTSTEDPIPPRTSTEDPIPPPTPVVIPRWIQLVVLPLALLGLWALARAAGPVLLILIIASVIALILHPTVRFLHQYHIPRGLAIPLAYLMILAVFVGLGLLLSSTISAQITHFSHNLPRYTANANHDLAQIQRFFNKHGINIHIQKQGQTALQTLQKSLQKHSGAIVSFSSNILSKVVTIAIDAILTLVLSIYLLVYGKQIGALVRRIMPPGDGTPEDDYPLLVQRAVSGYVRGQLMFSLIMGVSAGLALTLFGILGIFPDGQTYALFFGGWYALMELVPYIGPILGALPPVLLALFEHPLTAVWVILLFVLLQQLEGHLVAPQVFRISLRINPILVILALLIGYQLYGIAGALIALPVLAVLRQTVLYLRKHMVLEPWHVTTPGATAVRLDPGRCTECGAVVGDEDDFCRTCGSPLRAEVASGR